MKTIYISTLIILSLTGTVGAQDFQFPVIKGYGGVVDFEDAVKPESGAKILVDIAEDKTLKDGVIKGIDKIARMINLYSISGIDMKELEIAAIIHGPATKSVLTNEGYNDKYGMNNPNLPLIKQLVDAGVEFMVCGQAIERRGFSVETKHPDIKLSISAVTLLMEYQQKGYSIFYQ